MAATKTTAAATTSSKRHQRAAPIGIYCANTQTHMQISTLMHVCMCVYQQPFGSNNKNAATIKKELSPNLAPQAVAHTHTHKQSPLTPTHAGFCMGCDCFVVEKNPHKYIFLHRNRKKQKQQLYAVNCTAAVADVSGKFRSLSCTTTTASGYANIKQQQQHKTATTRKIATIELYGPYTRVTISF